jgi:HTH-type transcriptional regulator / antitoxin HigA
VAHLIHDDIEHAAALAELDALLDTAPAPGTLQSDELQLLALVIEMYEKRRWPMELPDPIDAILFVMDQRGLTRRDMEQYLGSRSRVSEVLARKRGLSIRMIRALHERLGIPLEVLVQETGRTA